MLAKIEEELARRRLELYRPYAKQIEHHNAGKDFSERLLMAGNQLGKAQPIDEPVLTPDGWRPIGDLAVGDKVVAGDGSITSVTAIHPQGVKEVFRLRFDRGESVRCCAEHLWSVTLPAHRFETRHSHGKLERNPGFGRQTVVDTAELIRRYSKPVRPKQRVVMPVVGAIQFEARDVPVDAYLLGLLLGDGCLRNGSVSIATADDEIVDAVNAALPDGVVARKSGAYEWNLATVHKQRVAANGKFEPRNPLKAELVQLGVYGKLAHEKFVPESYLLNSPDVRLAVLQGLMDTDGSVSADGAIEFTSTSKRLADDVAFLVRSFGGKTSTQARITSFTHGGEKRNGRVSYRVRVRLPFVEPFRLERKRERLIRPVSTCDEHVLWSVEPAGSSECVCITVDHPSRLYVTSDFIVTHNSLAGSAEWAMHACGRYPDWWDGATFDKAPILWAGGVTGESTRDNPQRLLVGPPAIESAWGTGMIPWDAIKDTTRAQGIPNLLDSVVVRHGGGGDVQAGESVISFKAYEKGREKWQGPTIDGVWFDEEPPTDIYSEGLTRTNNGQRGQFAQITFTPLLGMSEVVMRFLMPKAGDPGTKHRKVTTMTIDDAEHYSAEEKEKIVASYPAHEREARAMGIPSLGSGRIFPVPESDIKVNPFDIPAFWPRINGIDFGWDHPTAGVQLAWDRDSDCIYVIRCHRASETTPVNHAAAIRAWGAWVPTAWPHDGLQHDKGSGEQLAKQYGKAGLKMLPERATFPNGSNGVEAGLMEMLERMQTGRWKVFSNMDDWFEEFRMYHRKDGKVVKERDDLLSASRYGMMMIRFAKTRPTDESLLSPFVPADPAMGY